MAQVHNEPSLGDLFGDLARETSALVRQEVQLAKAEIGESTAQAGRGVASLLVGGAIAYGGFLFLLLAVTLGLVEFGVEWWLAALIVGVVVAVVGYALITRARDTLQASNLMPRRTIESLKEDKEWAQHQMS